MNILAIRDRWNAIRNARRKPAKVIPLRPDPEYRERKLAQFTPERRARYLRNVRLAGL
jgi:hypothetical protein